MARKKQRFCMFCGGWNLSKEHVWPAWAKGLLPDFPGYMSLRSMGENRSAITRIAQGPVSGLKIRVACQTCNNEWMSALEEAVKPLLAPMILGQPIQLTLGAQRTVAEWIALKMMVIEQGNPADVVLSQDERTAFLQDRIIPSHMRIHLAICGEGEWRSGVLSVPGTTWDRNQNGPLPSGRNLSLTTFGIGDLLVHSTFCKAPNIDFDELAPLSAGFVRLWPPSVETVQWPIQAARVTYAEAMALVRRGDRLFQIPGFFHMPELGNPPASE